MTKEKLVKLLRRAAIGDRQWSRGIEYCAAEGVFYPELEMAADIIEMEESDPPSDSTDFDEDEPVCNHAWVSRFKHDLSHEHQQPVWLRQCLRCGQVDTETCGQWIELFSGIING